MAFVSLHTLRKALPGKHHCQSLELQLCRSKLRTAPPVLVVVNIAAFPSVSFQV
jgi:hypothetical protein